MFINLNKNKMAKKKSRKRENPKYKGKRGAVRDKKRKQRKGTELRS